MALLGEKSDAAMPAAEIAEVFGAELKNCADASFSVCGFSTDTRTITAGNCFIALKGENFNGNLYAKQAAEKGAAMCILSEEPPENPGVPYLIVVDTVKSYGDLAHYYLMQRKAAGLRVIGVTGSSGKTTVKDMTAHILAANYRTYATSGNHNNHIGVPYTLLHMPKDAEVAVIEMGMNHAGEIDYLSHIAEPDLAVITNIGTAHIGNLGSRENIRSAKLEILNGMRDGGAQGSLIVSADDEYLYAVRESLAARTQVLFSSRCGNPDAVLSAEQIAETAENTRFTLRFCDDIAIDALLPMTGLHNVTDALLAIHAAVQLGMQPAAAAAALADFVPGAMRSERVKIANVTVIRDYYNANPEAMAAALQSLGTIAEGAQKWAILGNMNELGAFAQERHCELGALAKQSADRVWFCGENYKDFAAGCCDDSCAFETQAELIEALRAVLQTYNGAPVCILIKGSRGMHMERVSEMLETVLGEK